MDEKNDEGEENSRDEHFEYKDVKLASDLPRRHITTWSEKLSRIASSIPYDADGFVHTFNLYSNANDIRTFFMKYGFVAIQVLDKEACSYLMGDLYSNIEHWGNRFDRRDISTWDFWPEGCNKNFGICTPNSVFTDGALMLRQDPRLYQCFASLFGDNRQLMVNHCRYTFMRPTMLPGGKGEKWKSPSNLHIDMDPWRFQEEKSKRLPILAYDRPTDFVSENHRIIKNMGELHCQSVTNFLDNREEDGGFHCVPGFHKYFSTWLEVQENNQERGMGQYRFDRSHWFYSLSRRIPVRAGVATFWDQRVAHGSRPNNSCRARAVMMCKMFPKTYLPREQRRFRRKVLRKHIEGFRTRGLLTEHGKRVFDV